MKLAKDEIERAKDASPMDLFAQGIRSEMTREKYTRTLRKITCEFLEDILEGTFEERVAQLVRHGKEEPEWTRDLLLNLSKKLRERTTLAHDDPDYLNPTSFGNYFKPIKKLFDMTDVAMPWKRIYATYPEIDNLAASRGWTRDEIGAMVMHSSDSMELSMVLVLASSGVRAGGLDLEWRDLTPVYRAGDKLVLDPGAEDCGIACAMLEVYRGSAESYLTFITPEAYAALREYGRAWAGRMGRMPNPKDPMFLTKRGLPKKASYKVLRQLLDKTAARAGLRGDKDENARRHDVPLMNGFRRFWNKTCKEALSNDSPLASLIKKEFMMGHRGLVPLDKNYFKTTALELAREYLTVVPDLTISDAARLKQSTKRMSENIQKLESDKDARIANLEKKVDDLKGLNAGMLDVGRRVKDSKRAPTAGDADSMMALVSKLEEIHRDNLDEAKAVKDAEIKELKNMVARLIKHVGITDDPISDLDDEAERRKAAEEHEPDGAHPHHARD